jgi:diphthamide synthase (EF-2-diphthine--ammonia ligase)
MKALCWSGGKDSTLALIKSRPDLLITAIRGHCCVVSALPVQLVEQQAVRLGMPILLTEFSMQPEDRLRVVELLRSRGVTTVVLGDSVKEYDIGAFGEVCDAAGFQTEWPNLNNFNTAREFLATGNKARIVRCKKRPSLQGCELTLDLVAQLEAEGFDGSGNAGRLVYHTYVYDGPIFKNGASG